jgi:hypothetical protein
MVTAQNFGYDRFPPTANGWETTHPIPDKASPLQAEEEGATNLKRTNPRDNPHHQFHPTVLDRDGQDFTTYPLVLSLILT